MNIPIIIYEDDNILVVDKPSGVVVHPYDFSDELTLLDFLQEKIPESFDIANNTITLQDGRVVNLGGIVHKLDRDTSGVMIIAKNETIFNDLKNQFQEHSIIKKYYAIVEGLIKEDHFTINAPLGRNKKEYKQKVNPENPRGELREAITDVFVVKRFTETTLVELTPKTGRTHQLRAHMSHIGHPIIGDTAYGSHHKNDRIMLHAQSLTCRVGPGKQTFMSDVPEGFYAEHVHTHECH